MITNNRLFRVWAGPHTRPMIVAHSDWSMHPAKQRCAIGTLQIGGRYLASGSRPVGHAQQLLQRLSREAQGGALLAGFDFPIGLPRAYAKEVGIVRFLDFIREVGEGPWSEFFAVATTVSELSLHRPFYPGGNPKKGQAKQEHVARIARCARMVDLLRECDQPRSGRRAAQCMFWTLGPNQVGKGLIAGWRDVLLPALKADALVWPFHGEFDDLVVPGRTVIVETYPAEFYDHVRVGSVRKKSPESRRAAGPALIEWADSAGIDLTDDLRTQIVSGFGNHAEGEDDFDAVVGLFGMLEVVLGFAPPNVPCKPSVLAIEGWMFGQHSNDPT
jgi:hypothetical protein